MWKAIALLLVALVLASGQGPKQSEAQQQAILDYHLTLPRANQLIAAMEAMTKYVASLPDFAERMRKAMSQTPAQRLAEFEADPKAMAIAKQNGLTAKEYLIGVPALRMALLAAQGRASPMIIASPANVAFAKANLAELKSKMNAADGVRPAGK